MSYKHEILKMNHTEMIMTGILMGQLSEYFGKYEISFQFWGKDENNVFVEKDSVELWSTGGHERPVDAMIECRDYLDRINNKKRGIYPNSLSRTK